MSDIGENAVETGTVVRIHRQKTKDELFFFVLRGGGYFRVMLLLVNICKRFSTYL